MYVSLPGPQITCLDPKRKQPAFCVCWLSFKTWRTKLPHGQPVINDFTLFRPCY